VFSWLAHTLTFAAKRRLLDAPSHAQLEKLLEIPTEHWFVTDFALEHIGEPAKKFDLTDVFNERLRASPPTDVAHADELRDAMSAAYARFTERVRER
jgi:hypothetical protein